MASSNFARLLFRPILTGLTMVAGQGLFGEVTTTSLTVSSSPNEWEELTYSCNTAETCWVPIDEGVGVYAPTTGGEDWVLYYGSNYFEMTGIDLSCRVDITLTLSDGSKVTHINKQPDAYGRVRYSYSWNSISLPLAPSATAIQVCRDDWTAAPFLTGSRAQEDYDYDLFCAQVEFLSGTSDFFFDQDPENAGGTANGWLPLFVAAANTDPELVIICPDGAIYAVEKTSLKLQTVIQP